VSDGCRDKKDNGFKRIQAVRTPTDYNLHPIVRSLKTDKCGPHKASGKKPSRPTRLLKPWGRAPI